MALSVEKGRAEGGPGADRSQLWQPGEGQKVYRAEGDEKQIGSGHSKGGGQDGERERKRVRVRKRKRRVEEEEEEGREGQKRKRMDGRGDRN